jgi:2-polyprenyl-3-methyl-5-hydroxy-6-metoxy-1,4-benzoquinol methylase
LRNVDGVQMPSKDLKDLGSHFAFGDNWESYAKLINGPQIEEAEKGLLKLIPDGIKGRSFLDIGCGSGLHSLAAARLGASRILATDIDPKSVATTRRLLSQHATEARWQAEQISVFDFNPSLHGRFDVAYAWGVLHHTGDMWGAIRAASGMVESGGLLVMSLYRTTRCDAFWKAEKRWYAKASPLSQRLARACYIAAYSAAHTLAGRGSFRKFLANYKSSRGMDFYHDVHDWLGGYPYETTLAPEVDGKLSSLGFRAERIFARPTMTLGVLGSGCDEYVYRGSM